MGDTLALVEPTVPPADGSPIVLHERAVLKKFEGEITPESVPFEVLVIEDEKIVDRWTPEEDRPCPE